MQFDELILQDADDELQLRFHPQLTMLSGLGATERGALAEGILGALVGGEGTSTLRYLDGTGRPVTISNAGGQLRAQHDDDGTVVAEPLGLVAPDIASLRRLMLALPEDLGGIVARNRDEEPPELREARDTLDELAAELEAARGQEEALAELRLRLDDVEAQLRAALDGVARREYAQVLAQLERVRAEGAALQTGTAGIEADRQLLTNADAARALARRWSQASARVAAVRAEVPPGEPMERADQERLAPIPDTPPDELDERIAVLLQATVERDALDQRLQDLAVSKLPAPSTPLVAELGLLDQDQLWGAAERLAAASTAMQQVQVSLGGLEIDDMGPAPALIEDIEAAHRAVEDADRAAEAAKLPGLAGAGLGVTAGVLGLAASPVLLPVGLVGAAVAAGAGILRPRARRAKAVQAEQEALDRADASSYLGFHLRRVDASVDPKLRELVDATTAEHRGALARWTDLAGTEIEVDAALFFRDEVLAYNAAMKSLGDTADEIEALRRQLDEQAEPALAAARQATLEAGAAFLITEADLIDPRQLAATVQRQCDRGVRARALLRLDAVAADEQKAAGQLDDLLHQLGFDAGELDARVGALDWAVTRAQEREEARRRARPRHEIDAELTELQETAARLRKPEWSTVTAADAATPDIPELEARRDDLVQRLAEAGGDVDIERLADRHAAVERRVRSIEARLAGSEGVDPAAVADIQQHLLARLTVASQAAPHGDPVPMILDEVLQRVPADRTWDLLDMLLRLSEHQQLIYLTDDAFVAAWARQRALDGTIILLEPAPEHEPV